MSHLQSQKHNLPSAPKGGQGEAIPKAIKAAASSQKPTSQMQKDIQNQYKNASFIGSSKSAEPQ